MAEKAGMLWVIFPVRIPGCSSSVCLFFACSREQELTVPRLITGKLTTFIQYNAVSSLSDNSRIHSAVAHSLTL